VTFLTLLDHSKAFDSVSHYILITKLKIFLTFHVLQFEFIKSCLDGRLQAVVSRSQLSSLSLLTRSVLVIAIFNVCE